MDIKPKAAEQFLRLIKVMEKLRSPEGCSWDRKQNHETLKKYVLEEAQEVVEAIESGDLLNVREELGDLMMIIVFHSQIAHENGTFTIAEVCEDICDKLINRHPHVFGDQERGMDADKVVEMWGEIKTKEKADKKKIANRMQECLRFPSTIAATETVQNEANAVGFDFPTPEEALKKVYEEANEIKLDLSNSEESKFEEEVGDLLFSAINISRLLKVNPETALRKATEKFISRFDKVEKAVEKDGGFEGKSIEELDAYWDQVKIEE